MITHCQPRNRHCIVILLPLYLSRAVHEIERLIHVNRRRAALRVIDRVSLAVVARACRAGDEEVAAARIELDGERLRGRADGERALPQLAVVVVGQRDRARALRGRAANEGPVVVVVVVVVITVVVRAGVVRRVRDDIERMVFAGVGFVRREAVLVFATYGT